MSQKFFITHSWKDIDFARKLCNDLTANGLDGFFDERSIRPGESIPKRIEQGLEQCDIYIPVLSPDALKSRWADWEIDMAIQMHQEQGRPEIIPVIAEKCTIPTRLRHILYIDFVGRYDDALDDLLVKGFGIISNRARATQFSGTPKFQRAWSTPSWLLPAGVVVILIIAMCSLAGLVVSSLLNNSTPTPPAQAIVSPPTTIAATVVSINTPTLTPKPVDTLRPTYTFTPKLTDTPRPTASFTPTSTGTPHPTETLDPKLGIGSSKVSPIDSATMMYVPAGDFTMGSDDYADEKPPHTVFLDAFWIDKFEVTNSLYRKCVNASKCVPPSESKSYSRYSYFGNTQFDNYPVIYVSWNDANAYCDWADKKLPTEAEWEKSARGRDGRSYPWGNTFDQTLVNSSYAKIGDTVAVGSYPNGASPHGTLDMAGNVWEWVSDWWNESYYLGSPRANPTGPSVGQYKVIRGGSFGNIERGLRTYYRNDSTGVTRNTNNNIGFRCAQ